MGGRPGGGGGAVSDGTGGGALRPDGAARPVLTPCAALRPWVTWPAWAASLLLLALYPLFPHALDRAQFYPFIIGMVVLGLPHGAMDHLVIPHLRHRRVTARYLLAFVAGYGALALLYLALWRLAPGLAFFGFLLMAWLHWGQGDAYALPVFLGRSPTRSAASAALVWAVRGALPIILPVLAFPKTYQSVAGGILAWYGRTATAPSPGVVQAGWVALGVLTVAYLAAAWRENGPTRRAAFWMDTFEVGLLFALFTRVPPVLAVGVYFCLWHAARHIARLLLTDPTDAPPLRAGRVGQCLARAAWLSVPMTVGALLMLGGMLWAQARAPVSPGGLVYLYLSLVAALTFPHFLLVLWMDREEKRAPGAGIGVV